MPIYFKKFKKYSEDTTEVGELVIVIRGTMPKNIAGKQCYIDEKLYEVRGTKVLDNRYGLRFFGLEAIAA